MGGGSTHRRTATTASLVVLEARRAAGLTQQALAERLGTTASTISAYENSRMDPTLGTLEQLVEACGMRLRLAVESVTDAERRGGDNMRRRQSRNKEIMRLRAKAHAEAERLHGKPAVMPGFQQRALAGLVTPPAERGDARG